MQKRSLFSTQFISLYSGLAMQKMSFFFAPVLFQGLLIFRVNNKDKIKAQLCMCDKYTWMVIISTEY